MGPIRVGVYEPDEIFRRGVVSCLDDDPMLEVVEQRAAYRLPSAAVPRPPLPDVAVLAAIGEHPPACPLVVCAANRSCVPIPGAVGGNVVAVLARRTLGPEQLVSAVRAAAVGLRIMDAAALSPDLDERSLAVLRMLADGAAVREISDSLGWSERTIKGVISGVQREFHARTRTQMVVEALRRELI